jgi:hypothetical protein
MRYPHYPRYRLRFGTRCKLVSAKAVVSCVAEVCSTVTVSVAPMTSAPAGNEPATPNCTIARRLLAPPPPRPMKILEPPPFASAPVELSSRVVSLTGIRVIDWADRPPVLHFDAWDGGDGRWLSGTLHSMAREAEALQLGGETDIMRLADILAIQWIRR